MATTAWTGERVERIIGTLLQTGVILAGMVVLAGGFAYLAQNGHTRANYRTFSGNATEGNASAVTISGNAVAGNAADLRGLTSGFHAASVFHAAFHGDGRAIIEIGLLLLIATPVSRVAFSIVAFGLQRDWLYVAFTCIVLAILLFSLFGHGI